jgi:hypothetical protein
MGARLLREQLTRMQHQAWRYGPLQYIDAGTIDGKYRVRRLVLAPGLEGIEPAILEDAGRGIDAHSRAWAGFDIHGGVAMSLSQPKRTANGDDTGKLRQPNECKEFPE